jgi:penicillin-insensitive murein endopeptidase
VRTDDQLGLTRHWTPAHAQLLRIAASHPQVDRIFVAAIVKSELCRIASPEDREWMQRIRPIAGHNYHFHVRLRCPAGSRDCETQSPTVAELSRGGDGCDDTLEWWLTDYLNPPRVPRDPNAPPPEPRRHPREYTLADLPNQCRAVVTSN